MPATPPFSPPPQGEKFKRDVSQAESKADRRVKSWDKAEEDEDVTFGTSGRWWGLRLSDWSVLRRNRSLGNRNTKMKRLAESHWAAGSDVDSRRMSLAQGSGQRLTLEYWVGGASTENGNEQVGP